MLFDYEKISELIVNHQIPVLYLDTNILIEFAKIKNGNCKDAHRIELEKLMLFLEEEMRRQKVTCPMGNQFYEMAATEKRSAARNFIHQFANSILQDVSEIENYEYRIAYEAFLNSKEGFMLSRERFFDFEPIGKQFYIPDNLIYNKKVSQKISLDKKEVLEKVTKIKATNSLDLEEQLYKELDADYTVLSTCIQKRENNDDSNGRFFDCVLALYNNRILTPEMSEEEWNKAFVNYIYFLKSKNHHFMPYVWIRSVLWANRMVSNKKIRIGDNQDSVWAAAYFPVIDYAITDVAFCDLLNSSGLSDKYGVKVYSVRNLEDFISDISLWTNKMQDIGKLDIVC